MSEPKTKENDGDVLAFLNSVPDEQKRRDALQVMVMMQEVTGEEPRMWGDSIVGYGKYSYKYASGREGEWPLVGFSPRKQDLTLYIVSGFDNFDDLREKLGKHKVGKSCLYIKRLADVNPEVLREMIRDSAEHMRTTNP